MATSTVSKWFAAVLVVGIVAAYALYSVSIAAEVAVDTTVFANNNFSQHSGPAAVWTSTSTGYVFYTDSTGGIYMASTTNGGTSWSTPRNVDSVNTTDAVAVSVWWEGWTPATTSTKYIHIATVDLASDDNYYTRLDTTTGALSTSVAGAANGATCARGTDCYTAMTQAEDGRLFMIVGDASASGVTTSTCAATSTCTTASNWYKLGNGPVEAGALDAGNDYYYMAPIPGTNNIMLVYQDTSSSTVDYNVWSATSSSWWYTGTTPSIQKSAELETTYDAQYGGITVSTTTGLIHFAFVDDVNDFTTQDHDIKWYTYSTSTWSWTAKTNVVTDASGGLTGVKPAIDATNGTLYAVYVRRTTINTAATGNLYYRTSTDGGTSWSAESSALNASADDLNGLGVNILSNYRIGATWNYTTAPKTDSQYAETVVSITAGGGGGGSTAVSTPAIIMID